MMVPVIGSIIAKSRPEVPGAGENVLVFSKGAQSFIRKGKIQVFGRINRKQRIQSLPLFENRLEVQFCERSGNPVVIDILHLHKIVMSGPGPKIRSQIIVMPLEIINEPVVGLPHIGKRQETKIVLPEVIEPVFLIDGKRSINRSGVVFYRNYFVI